MLILRMFKSSCVVMNPFVTKPWEIHQFFRWFICGNPSHFQSWKHVSFHSNDFVATKLLIKHTRPTWDSTPPEVVTSRIVVVTSRLLSYHFVQFPTSKRNIQTPSERRESSQPHTLSLPGSGDLMVSTAPTSSSAASATKESAIRARKQRQ